MKEYTLNHERKLPVKLSPKSDAPAHLVLRRNGLSLDAPGLSHRLLKGPVQDFSLG